ncbi:MAG: hypothetical protein KDE03_18005, partial [Rhodobacteraceae bacterium]|nr:hypothetical protein [Paracoccaceae bacterium]
MIAFTVYDTATGAILRTGVCQDDMLAAQAGTSETAIEGTFDGEEEYLPGGVANPRPALPTLTITGQTLGFASAPPSGTLLTVWDSIYPDPVEITASDVHLAAPVTARISIDPPWPYVGA